MSVPLSVKEGKGREGKRGERRERKESEVKCDFVQ